MVGGHAVMLKKPYQEVCYIKVNKPLPSVLADFVTQALVTLRCKID